MTNVSRYAVFGNPVAHSLSPKIHTMFSEQLNDPILYQAVLVEIEDFVRAVRDFFLNSGKGLSITVPFKIDAYHMATIKTSRAQQANSANTLYKKDNGDIVADNTDGLGIVNDLTKNHHLDLKNKNILIIGAGGATRGVLNPILKEQPNSLTIANRTKSKAEELIDHFSSSILKPHALEEIKNSYDIVINATSAGVTGSTPNISSSIIGEKTVCYDMFYKLNDTTPFNIWAKENNAKNCIDGLGMLVEQAAEQFFLWRNKKPETKKIIKKLRPC